MTEHIKQQIETICENSTYTLRDKPVQREIEWKYTKALLTQGYSLAEQELSKEKFEHATTQIALGNALKGIEELKAWKKEAIAVMPDYQAIAKALNIKLGESVHDKILPGITTLIAKVNFYRETTDKVRELVFNSPDIGEPCQPLYDAIVDKINSQSQEITRLKELIAQMSKEYNELYEQSKTWKDESGN